MCRVNLPVGFSPHVQLFLPVLLHQAGLIILRQMCYNRHKTEWGMEHHGGPVGTFFAPQTPDKTDEADGCTSSVPQHHLLLIHQPAEAGELQILSRWGLDRDVPAVPVVVHPVLLLLDLHQHNVAQVLADPHVIGVHLQFSQQADEYTACVGGNSVIYWIIITLWIITTWILKTPMSRIGSRQLFLCVIHFH